LFLPAAAPTQIYTLSLHDALPIFELVAFLFEINGLHVSKEFRPIFLSTFGIRRFREPIAPKFGDYLVVDDGRIHAANAIDRHSHFAAELFDPLIHLVSRAGRVPNPTPLLADGIAA